MKNVSTILVILFAIVACSPGYENNPPDSSIEFPPIDSVDFVHQASDIPVDDSVLYGVLPNGLRYAVRSNETPSKTATLLMRVDAGSLDEQDDTRGIAHFLEHMAFNGSEAIPEGEMIKRLERLGLSFGADTNASTSFDQTVYQLELPDVTDDLLDEALFIFRETAERLTLAPDAIDDERGVILAEKRARNSPSFRALIASLQFQTEGTNLVDRLPIGTVETIETMTPEQFRTFYEQQYRPEDTFVVLVGDRPVEQLAQKIESAFADWVNQVEPVADAELDAIAFDAPRYGAFFDPEVSNYISLVTITPRPPENETRDTVENRADGMPIYFANAMLNRRLSKRVRSGEASYTSAGVSASPLFESADVAGLRISAEPDRLRSGFIEAERILRQALDHGFTQAELDEQIVNARKSWEIAVQTAPTRRTPSLARQILSRFATETVFSTPQTGLDLFEAAIVDVSLEDINTALQETWAALETAPQLYLQSDTVIETPEIWLAAMLAESRSASLDPIDDVAVDAFAYTDWGTSGIVAERRQVDDIGATLVRFENGVLLNMKPTDFQKDVIRIGIDAGSGTAWEPQDDPAFTMQLGAIMGASGLEAHTVDDIRTLTAGSSAGVRRGFGFRAMGLSGTITPEDLRLQLDMLAAHLTHPAFRPETRKAFQSRIRANWSKIDSTPSGAASIEIPPIITSGHWSSVHPREEALVDIDMSAIERWYDENVRGGPIEIAIVGDFAVDVMIDEVARTFGALPGPRDDIRELPERSLDQKFPEGQKRPYEFAHSGELDTALLRIYWPSTGHRDLIKRRQIGMLTTALRLELTDVLREEEGATYSPSAFRSTSELTPDYGYIAVSMEAEPAELDRLTGLVESIVARLVEEGVSEDLFERAMTPTLENLESSLEDNGYWFGVIDNAQSRPETLDYHRTRDADYTDMQASDLSAIATELLDPEKALRFHIVPEG